MLRFLMHGRSSTWGLWKGMDRRTFHSAMISPAEVVHLVWEELALWSFAHTLDPGD